MIKQNQIINATVLIAALGYFVDIYDLILFSIVRISSLKSIGVPDYLLLSQGVFLLNMQMSGMLLGGVLWGVWGDKRGRVSVLLGSILLYSVANIANAFVATVPQYAILRFIAGVGLAGELGAGIALVCEVIPKHLRAWSTTVVATVGVLGAIVASLIGESFDWRIAYIIGGIMGLSLLVFRMKANESILFIKSKGVNVRRGSFRLLFKNKNTILKYLRCISIGVPLWFVVGVLITFAPEIGKAIGMKDLPTAGKSVMFAYIGLALGDLISGAISQIIQSRKKVVFVFMMLNLFFMLTYLLIPQSSLNIFYLNCLCLGFASGYWAVFVTIAAEQFGTNVRSTVATTVPNFVRGSVVISSLSFNFLRSSFGIIHAGLIVAMVCVTIAFIALVFMEETHGKDLDYMEM